MLSTAEAYGRLGTSRKGLTDEEATARLAIYGDNVLSAKKPVPMWRRFSAHLLNMFAILLWVAAALSFLSDQTALGWAVILVILLNAVFAFVQEFRAEKAIEALRNMLPPKAKVIRGGVLKNNKGMNLPNTKLAISALTAKDISDVLYCIKADVDYIALSFVRHAKDIDDLRSFLKKPSDSAYMRYGVTYVLIWAPGSFI